jgi:hypothetical protein
MVLHSHLAIETLAVVVVQEVLLHLIYHLHLVEDLEV